MVRFNVAGVLLDTPSDLKLSLQKTNILFGFDSLKCERTTSFDVPVTSNNDRIFGFSRMLNAYGEGMRRRYDAQMQGSGVTKDGYLYVDGYNKDKYRCIFVTGEMVGLQRLRDMGQLAELAEGETRQTVFDTTHEENAYATATAQPFGLIRHYQGASLPCLPSVGVPWMLDAIRAKSGVTITPPDIAQYLRVIVPQPATASALNAIFTVRGLGDRPYQGNDSEPCNMASVAGGGVIGVTNVYLQTRGQRRDDPYYVNYWNYDLQVFVAHQTIDITFPASTPADIFLVRYNWPSTAKTEEWDDRQEHHALDFLGGYSFAKSQQWASQGESYDNETGLTSTGGAYTTEGEPLAGRTVTIKSGERFFFVTPRDFCATYPEGSLYYKVDWSLHQPSVRLDATVEASDSVAEVGDTVRLKDNLPPMTAVDVLKMIAAASGTQLMYSDTDGVTFDTLDINEWPQIDLTGKVVGISDLKRTFADYAQLNRVRYADDDLVPEANRIEATYAINNVNLAEDKVLQDMPVSSGASTIVGGNEYTYIANADDVEAKEYVLARHGGQPYLRRVYLPANDGLAHILDESTSVTISVRLSLWEYERITPKVLLYYNGTRYVWTGAKWSNGLATIEAAKV